MTKMNFLSRKTQLQPFSAPVFFSLDKFSKSPPSKKKKKKSPLISKRKIKKIRQKLGKTRNRKTRFLPNSAIILKHRKTI